MGGYPMSEQERDTREHGRAELPIERGFPIERVNEIVEKESRAKQWYRPIYTMHKWWARRPGALFRSIILYSLLDDETTSDDVEVYEPGENQRLGDNGISEDDLIKAVDKVDMDDPESLWEFFPKDVRIKDKNILDPFMGGGTTLVEASRFGVKSNGVDLNPVAWFVTKKQLDAGQTSVEELERAFKQVKEDVAEEILKYYKTPCPNCDGEHDADVMYYFWIKEIDCISCGHKVPLFKDYRVAAGRFENDDKENVLCPQCETISLVDNWQVENECSECSFEYNPKNGNVTRGGYYNCPECGQKDSITDTIQSQGDSLRLYAVEYYCERCDERGFEKSSYKGYKKAEVADKQLFEEAKREWDTRTDLHSYTPSEEIPDGWKTTSGKFSGSAPGAGDLRPYGYEKWEDLFTERQLLCLGKLLKSIDSISDQNTKEFLLLAFSDAIRYNTKFVTYNNGYNKADHMFKANAFVPTTYPVENNVWGTKFGSGSFTAIWEMMLRGIDYANNPTERYVENGENKETSEFTQPVGLNTDVQISDMRDLTLENEFDAVITDPPYYDNVIYSELSEVFYVWQKILLSDEYPEFDNSHTPREDSIVTNPALDKTAEDFEHEMGEALAVINQALVENGILAFTYHHSDEESWGELLQSLCNNGFEVTATYPINSDLNKFTRGEAVAFDIVIVARPSDERQPISWNSLRRRIVRTAKKTRETLEENRDLKTGDIGVIEMGKCFQEYSQHHGEVRRAGDVMTAKEVVNEIYGIIQEGDLGEQDVYLYLLEEYSPTYNDLNKHLKGSDASEERMREMQLFRMDGGDFELLDWRDEKRQAYVQTKVEEGNGDLTELDKAHFLRYRFENDRTREAYLSRWNLDDLREVCEDLAATTGDETYLKMLGVDTTLAEITDE